MPIQLAKLCGRQAGRAKLAMALYNKPADIGLAAFPSAKLPGLLLE
jgi:hypothetical protein